MLSGRLNVFSVSFLSDETITYPVEIPFSKEQGSKPIIFPLQCFIGSSFWEQEKIKQHIKNREAIFNV